MTRRFRPWPVAVALVLVSACGATRAADGGDAADLEALLNQPVYAASRFAQDAADAPAAVTVLTAGDIRAFGWRTLAEVLNGARGVFLRYDRFYQYVGVRGLARPGDFSSRLLILIDGMRVNDNIYDQAGAGREFPLDIGLIERVEFIPGPGSALYGSNAVLGVVNIVTRSGAAMLGDAVEAELGSAGSRRIGFSSGSERGADRVLVAGRIELRPGESRYYPEFGDPSSPAAWSNGGDRETDRKLFARWTHGELTATGLLSQRRKLIPTGAFGTVFGSRDTSGTDRYAFADLQWQRDLDAQRQLVLRGSVGQYEFDGRFDYGPPDGRQHLAQTGRWIDLETRWLWSGWADHRLVLGLDLRQNLEQRQRSSFDGEDGGVTADIQGRSHRVGAFVNDEWTLAPSLRAVLGARVDRQLDGGHVATPRLALVWSAAPGLQLKALDGRAFREPNAYESQYEDLFQRANPQLRRESLRARELAVEWRALAQLRLAASLYRYKVSDLIEQQFDEAADRLVYNNAGTVHSGGAELEGDYVDTSGWRLRASWTRQRTREAGSDQQIGNSPVTLLKMHATLPVARHAARVGVEAQRVGTRRTLAGDTLAPHLLVGLTVQVDPPGSAWWLSGSVYNLFDRDYADPGGPELVQDQLAQDGRQWRLQFGLRF